MLRRSIESRRCYHMYYVRGHTSLSNKGEVEAMDHMNDAILVLSLQPGQRADAAGCNIQAVPVPVCYGWL